MAETLARSRGPHAFVADLAAPVLDADDDHHLRRALRLRVGDALTVGDGAGGWRPARFGADAAVTPDGEIVVEPRPEPLVTIAFAPVKGQRPEWAVQKLTELGVDRIWLLVAARSVVRWEGERAASHRTRLERVAREAAMQSRRAWLPEVRAGVTAAEAAAVTGAALAHPGGTAPGLDRPTVLIGPEGGWTDDEVAGAPALAALGPTVLRTETAAVAAGSLLVALRAGLVAPGDRTEVGAPEPPTG